MFKSIDRPNQIRVTRRQNNCRNLITFFLLALILFLAACRPAAEPTVRVAIQAALPTPTLEPTFTPISSPTTAPQPSPTTTSTAEPTPTPMYEISLLGRILDQATDQPVAGATVSLDAFTATTDADGRYILTDLSSGQYVLAVTHDGYDPALSSILTLNPDQIATLDLELYAPNTTPYPQDPMLTNPLDPDGASTPEDAECLARLQGLTGEVSSIEETKLRGEFLVNYKIGDEVRSAVAELSHDAWKLTDEVGQIWWIIKVCGNLARMVPQDVKIATPKSVSLPPMAEVVADSSIVRACAAETCAEVGTVNQGARIEVFGCLSDGSWCQVGLPDGGSGWCTGRSLRQLAVAEVVPLVEVVLPTATPEAIVTGEGRIVFMSRPVLPPTNNFEIYVMNADGSDLSRLTNHPAWDDNPAWSPDGQRIAFGSDRDGKAGIYVMNADGSGVTYLTSGYEPTWSPDGQKIAFPQGENIHIVNTNGTGVTRLTNFRWEQRLSSLRWPIWSPDSQKIAFVATRPMSEGSLEIYVINIDGSGLTRLTNSLGEDNTPAWSPDGQKIAFVSWRDDLAETVNIERENPYQVQEGGDEY